MKLAWTAALAASIAVLAAPVSAQSKPTELGVGVFTFVSGPAAAYGLPGKNAAELMIDEINAKGGIGGVPIKPTYVDEAQGTEGVITEYRRLASDPTNQVMIAALSSGNCLALKPVAEDLKVPTIAWNCDAHQLLADGKSNYYFRPNGNTIPEFVAYAVYLLQHKPDVKRIAIINPDYAFGHDGAKIFTAAMKALKPDVEVVSELFPKMGTANFQTQISKLLASRPDVIFSNLWGADLENFIRQASPRGLFSKSQAVLALGETVLQSVTLPENVIVGVLGDGWWLSPDAQSNPATKAFVADYKKRYGEYPVFPSMKMANSLVYMKAAYETAMKKNGGKWPSRNELAEAMSGSDIKTLTGETLTRPDHEGVVDQIIGVTTKSPDYKFPIIGQMVRYKGESLTAPTGQDALKWVESLKPNFLTKQPKPGSYK